MDDCNSGTGNGKLKTQCDLQYEITVSIAKSQLIWPNKECCSSHFGFYPSPIFQDVMYSLLQAQGVLGTLQSPRL